MYRISYETCSCSRMGRQKRKLWLYEI